jgi:molybdopterin converting factor small subunit
VRVTVNVYDHIREALGRGRLEVELPVGSSVKDLFRHLAAQTHPLFGQLVDDDSSLYGVNLLILDGDRLSFPGDLTRRLSPGAQLHLIPPITGGCAKSGPPRA